MEQELKRTLEQLVIVRIGVGALCVILFISASVAASIWIAVSMAICAIIQLHSVLREIRRIKELSA